MTFNKDLIKKFSGPVLLIFKILLLGLIDSIKYITTINTKENIINIPKNLGLLEIVLLVFILTNFRKILKNYFCQHFILIVSPSCDIV